MLLGVIRPTSGGIELFEEGYSPQSFAARQRIGVIPEKHPQGMWKWMTAEEYLIFFGNLFGVQKPQTRIDYLLGKVRLLDVRNRRISGFSRGMLQKLSFVRALLPEPDILFMDEPISGLDPIGIKQIRDLILEENREGRTIFISSHLLSEMEKICHRIAVVHQGKLLAEDTMKNLIKKLSAEAEIQIDLELIPDTLLEECRKLDFVREASSIDNTLVIQVSGEGDYRKNISQFLFEKSFVPLRIQQKDISLEEVFLTITRDNVEFLAKLGEEK
jgi:ABC-2 type transport system ATP-binding protein